MTSFKCVTKAIGPGKTSDAEAAAAVQAGLGNSGYLPEAPASALTS